MTLTPKETALLKDLKDQEKLCADKYGRYAGEAKDPQLKSLFSQIGKTEQGHLDTLTQIAEGCVPYPTGGKSNLPTFSASYTGDCPDKQNDCYLCTDVLTMEKHASGLYDTCIFEFRDENVRTLLGSIQTQEQNHGKMLYDYMAVNGMYA